MHLISPPSSLLDILVPASDGDAGVNQLAYAGAAVPLSKVPSSREIITLVAAQQTANQKITTI